MEVRITEIRSYYTQSTWTSGLDEIFMIIMVTAFIKFKAPTGIMFSSRPSSISLTPSLLYSWAYSKYMSMNFLMTSTNPFWMSSLCRKKSFEILLNVQMMFSTISLESEMRSISSISYPTKSWIPVEGSAPCPWDKFIKEFKLLF